MFDHEIALLLNIFDFLHNFFTKANVLPNVIKTSCVRGDTICLPWVPQRLARRRWAYIRNVAVVYSHAHTFSRSSLHLPHALRPQWVKRPGDFDLESGVCVRVTWATSVPILVFLGLSVLDLSPIYVTEGRQTEALFNAPAY